MNNLTYKLSDYDLDKFPTLFTGIAGVYLWTNSVNGKTYVGSSSNIRRRVSEYLNKNRLSAELIRGESLIYKAMLKYGYNSFSFTVLELTTFAEGLLPEEKADLLEAAEQKYFNILKPKYNLLKTAGSNQGFKMSDIARAKISLAKKGKPSHRKGMSLSENTRQLMSVNSAKAKTVYMYSKEKILMNTFPNILQCSKLTSISRYRIGRNLDSNLLVDNYYFTTKPI